jgi:hypothetical protein
MLKPYLNIIALRGHAHEVPYSPLTIFIWLLLDFALVVVAVSLLSERMAANLWLEVFDVAFTAAALYLVLYLYKHQARFVQCYTAILGANVIIFAVLIAIALIFGREIFGFLVQPLYLWFLVVVAAIFKDALEVPWIKAILWVLAMEMTRLVIVLQLLKGIP